jgi:hypothetical protein
MIIKKIEQALAIYENQANVHNPPEIYHYWSNKYLTPLFFEAGFQTIDEFFHLVYWKLKIGPAE